MKTCIALILAFVTLTLNATEQKATSAMLGLRTTVYVADDVQQAKRWYSEAFGIAPYFDEPYYVGFNIRGFELGLMPAKEQQPGSSRVIAYWGVEDIDAEYSRLTGLGATPLEPVMDVGGGVRLGVLQDPFGNPLGLIYNPSFQASEQ